MSKAEKIFWVVLILSAGIMVGAIVQMLLTPSKPTPACNDGHSTQVVDGVVYKTYTPALDDCNK